MILRYYGVPTDLFSNRFSPGVLFSPIDMHLTKLHLDSYLYSVIRGNINYVKGTININNFYLYCSIIYVNFEQFKDILNLNFIEFYFSDIKYSIKINEFRDILNCKDNKEKSILPFEILSYNINRESFDDINHI